MISLPVQPFPTLVRPNTRLLLSTLIPTFLNPVLVIHLLTLLSTPNPPTTVYDSVFPYCLDVHAHPLLGLLMTFAVVSGQLVLYWIGAGRLVGNGDGGKESRGGAVQKDQINIKCGIDRVPET